MKIKNFKSFIKESISGTELVGHMGPNYGDQKLPITITQGETEVLQCDIDNKVYTYDDYQSSYNDYLKLGKRPLNGFNKQNLNTVVSSLQKVHENFQIEKTPWIEKFENLKDHFID